MNADEANRFCDEWLNTWTGNTPNKLIDYYAPDAFYSDPTVRKGLKGHELILPYFKKLLKNNPAWKWTREELIPTEKGFVLKWKAEIPAGRIKVVEYGLDIVEVSSRKITRNEVYFDSFQLMKALQSLK